MTLPPKNDFQHECVRGVLVSCGLPLHLPERSTDAAFLTGRYSRIRRKLMLITALVPALLTVDAHSSVSTDMPGIKLPLKSLEACTPRRWS